MVQPNRVHQSDLPRFSPAVLDAAYATPAGQTFGSATLRFPQLRNMWRLNEDSRLLKWIANHEHVRFELRLEMMNLVNRHYCLTPQFYAGNAAYGKVPGIDGAANPHQGQPGARVEW
jgi:hypothetical protein